MTSRRSHGHDNLSASMDGNVYANANGKCTVKSISDWNYRSRMAMMMIDESECQENNERRRKKLSHQFHSMPRSTNPNSHNYTYRTDDVRRYGRFNCVEVFASYMMMNIERAHCTQIRVEWVLNRLAFGFSFEMFALSTTEPHYIHVRRSAKHCVVWAPSNARTSLLCCIWETLTESKLTEQQQQQLIQRSVYTCIRCTKCVFEQAVLVVSTGGK